jgi:hypothetical protein
MQAWRRSSTVEGIFVMTRTVGAGLLFAVAAVAALSGCSSGGSGASPTASSTADAQQALTVGRSFAQCARTHGQPNFPDPTIRNGRLEFGTGNTDNNGTDIKQAVIAVQEACGSILQQLPPAMQARERAPSAEDMQHLRQFAQCLRQHGMPDWPDPKSDGTFPIVGTPLASEGKSQRFLDAGQACKQYWDRGISAS